MSRKEILIHLGIVSLIFLVGVLVRVESVHPNAISPEDQFYQDQNGLPYMYEADSYYNYRLTKNYLDHGYLGDKIINGREWDLHSYYPPGVPLDYPPLIVYLTAFAYYLVNLFSQIPLLVVCFWLPAFIAPLAGVVAFFIVRRYTNDYGAAAAGFLVVLAPLYFLRTVPGWFDTDMFNILMPLIVVGLFMEAIHTPNLKKGLLISVLSAFFMFLFALAWNGWQLYFYLLVSYSILYAFWCKIKRKDVKKFASTLFAFVAVTLILVTLCTGFLNLIKLFYVPLDLIKIFDANGLWNPWPDIYISVSELGKPSIEKIILWTGFSLFAGILGFIWIFRILINQKFKKLYLEKMTWFFYLFLILWTIVGFIALNKGSRFIIFIIPPLVISSGIMIGICVDYLDILNKFGIFRQKKYLNKVIATSILIIVVLSSLWAVHTGVSVISAGANDDLWNAAEWINNNTSPEAVVISSWSYGHFLTGIANRPVLLDGRMAYIETLPIRNYDSAYPYGSKSPGTMREYWVEKAFFTDNETLSRGIFRMLSSSGDLATLTLDEYTGNTAQTVEILNHILGVDNNIARSILVNRYHLTNQETDKVLNYTHTPQPAAYVILTNDEMINKSFWTFYFGGWDFQKVQPGDYTYNFGRINQNDEVINTTNGVRGDLETGNITYNGEVPSLIITTKNGLVSKRYLKNNSNLMVVLLMDEGRVVVMDKKFENSLFIKLFLLKKNTEHFKSIYKNNTTIVWEPLF
ncbi:MAG: peptide transporter [Methanobacteriales archaeon Met13]